MVSFVKVPGLDPKFFKTSFSVFEDSNDSSLHFSEQCDRINGSVLEKSLTLKDVGLVHCVGCSGSLSMRDSLTWVLEGMALASKDLNHLIRFPSAYALGQVDSNVSWREMIDDFPVVTLKEVLASWRSEHDRKVAAALTNAFSTLKKEASSELFRILVQQTDIRVYVRDALSDEDRRILPASSPESVIAHHFALRARANQEVTSTSLRSFLFSIQNHPEVDMLPLRVTSTPGPEETFPAFAVRVWREEVEKTCAKLVGAASKPIEEKVLRILAQPATSVALFNLESAPLAFLEEPAIREGYIVARIQPELVDFLKPFAVVNKPSKELSSMSMVLDITFRLEHDGMAFEEAFKSACLL